MIAGGAFFRHCGLDPQSPKHGGSGDATFAGARLIAPLHLCPCPNHDFNMIFQIIKITSFLIMKIFLILLKSWFGQKFNSETKD
jgi:hypothetical protein